jgi:hypothetical protein
MSTITHLSAVGMPLRRSRCEQCGTSEKVGKVRAYGIAACDISALALFAVGNLQASAPLDPF